MPPKAPPSLPLQGSSLAIPHSYRLTMEAYALMYHSTRSNVDNAPWPPQEAPVEDYSDTYSEELYVFSSDEECHSEDAVQHAPWVARERLPLNMQPQDGAFCETSHYEDSLKNNRTLRHEAGRTNVEETQSHLRGNDTGSSDSRIHTHLSSVSDQAGRRGCPPSLHSATLRN